ncbi:putative diguanylate cyclase YegE [mine drainage metagenome]|jgi:PAS domain S-box-containing protein|uniref:histidine kinase n=1 Tax=mine drainage metagenome TaxID=410659 RepID=A0A1J5QYS6_9ZZZZ
MADTDPDDELYLSTAAPSVAQQRLALAVFGVSLALFVLAAPFARVQFAGEPAFLPGVQSAYVVVAATAAALLFGQYLTRPSVAMLALVAGYLYAALMGLVHTVEFPRLFTADGLFGHAYEGTAWLYFLWHGGYALFMLAYAALGGARRWPLSSAQARRLAWLVLGLGVPALVALLTWAAVSPAAHLPALMRGDLDGSRKFAVALVTWLLGAGALLALWRKRPRAVLDLWLLVAVAADMFDTALAAVLNHARFDLGWYAGRAYGLLAGAAVLLMVFYSNGMLYAQLARLRAAERQRARERLQESEGRFQATFEHAATGIALVSPDGRFLRVNARLCQITGYRADELLARRFHDITHPDDLDADLSELRRLLDGEIGSYTLEKRYVHRDGARVWVNLTVSLVRTREGAPDYFVAMVEDITTRKATEAALAESQQRLQLLIDHAPAALAMFDREMRYLAASRRWIEDYGLGGRPLLGRSHYEIFPEIGAAWKAAHQRALAGEVIRCDEDRFERADSSECWLRWELRPWHAADGEIGGIVIFTEDTTGLVEARRAIVELNAGLETRVAERTAELAAANAELDAFAYAVSHDLRAPLRAMSGFAQALREDAGEALGEDASADLREISAASRRMGELIEGILALSRSTRGEFDRSVVDVSAIATRVLREFGAREPQRHVDCRVEPGLAVQGDARMLESALANLLENAWKYSAKVDAARIDVYAETDDGRRWICVRDNGAGFDMAYAKRLFQPFQRLHRQDEFPGMGIGLATVQRIARRHGGEVRAHAEPGRGAVFCLYLPAAAPAPAP